MLLTHTLWFGGSQALLLQRAQGVLRAVRRDDRNRRTCRQISRRKRMPEAVAGRDCFRYVRIFGCSHCVQVYDAKLMRADAFVGSFKVSRPLVDALNAMAQCSIVCARSSISGACTRRRSTRSCISGSRSPTRATCRAASAVSSKCASRCSAPATRRPYALDSTVPPLPAPRRLLVTPLFY